MFVSSETLLNICFRKKLILVADLCRFLFFSIWDAQSRMVMTGRLGGLSWRFYRGKNGAIFWFMTLYVTFSVDQPIRQRGDGWTPSFWPIGGCRWSANSRLGNFAWSQLRICIINDFEFKRIYLLYLPWAQPLLSPAMQRQEPPERMFSNLSKEEGFEEKRNEDTIPSIVKGSAVLSRSNSMLSTASDESGRDIKLRTMSWKKTAAVLFGEYVCIAILSFPSSFMALGYVGGIIATLSIGVVTLYTSLTLWKFQMKHPECRDICDIGYKLFGNSRIAYELTTFGLLANNLMILGLHTSTGAKVFDTLTNSQYCNIIWAIVTMVICILLSLPRTLTQVSFQSIISASKSQSIWKCVGLWSACVFASMYAVYWPFFIVTQSWCSHPSCFVWYSLVFKANLLVTFLALS